MLTTNSRSYQSGTWEVKLYCTVLVAMKESGMRMTLVDYVPCVPTPAGTGEGMGFMYWSPKTGQQDWISLALEGVTSNVLR